MKNEIKNKTEIILYRTQDSDVSIDVLVENDTVWLTQSQMSMLFKKGRTTINEHIKNVFSEGELDEKVSCRKFRHDTPHGAIEGKTKTSYTNLYNLDVIISVGYRVKSKRGTEFRIWATQRLKDYIIKGYAVNDKLKLQQYDELKQTVKLLSNVFQNKEIELSKDETEGLIKVITDYQTFDCKELYPSIEEKAAMLLYLITKNHSFSDGNKRIAAFLFLWFLQNNGILYKENGQKLIENNTLVALTLMIAESRTEEKDLIVKVIVNLINKNN